jgi:hypothetical protein
MNPYRRCSSVLQSRNPSPSLNTRPLLHRPANGAGNFVAELHWLLAAIDANIPKCWFTIKDVLCESIQKK